MVDREARNKLGELLRHLASGQITNDQFEDAVPHSPDVAIDVIQKQAWMLYGDLYEHKLVGRHAVLESDKSIVARFILFLNAELEYEWPKHPLTGIRRLVAQIFSFGILPRYVDRRWKSIGDFKVWPFIPQSDFDRCKDNPKLLKGNDA